MSKKKRINASMKKAERRKQNAELGIYINEIYNLPKEDMEEEEEEEIPELSDVRRDKGINFIRVNDVIHDKSCRMLDSIAESDYIVLERYDKLLCQCVYCAMRSYIRTGCLDFNRITFYEKVYKQGKVPVELLEEMYLHNNMTTHFDENVLCVNYKDDAWRIIFSEDFSKGLLFHNNYVIAENGDRVITEGYHKQVEDYIPTLAIMNLIKNYSYELHKKKMIEKLAEDMEKDQSISVPEETEVYIESQDSKEKIRDLLSPLWENKTAYETLDILADIQDVINETREAKGILEDDIYTIMSLKTRYKE